jgi:molybdate transport system substrate-binding protein
MRSKAICLILICLLATSCNKEDSATLTIGTSANMQFAMQELTRAFTDETGIACETVVSSSGKLTAQIMEGSPIDVFVSADMKYPGMLYQKGLTIGQPKIYAYGKLVLFTMAGNLDPTMEVLTDESIRHVAIANPKTAPYGTAAIEVLQHYQLYEAVAEKLVYGESIAQTNQFIATGAAEFGLTAMSLVMAPQLLGKGKWLEIDSAIYTPIAQGIVILRNNKTNPETAEDFYKFIFSGLGKEILSKFGYSTPE